MRPTRPAFARKMRAGLTRPTKWMRVRFFVSPRIRAGPRVCRPIYIQFFYNFFLQIEWFLFFTFSLEKIVTKNKGSRINTTTNINWMLHNSSINLSTFLTYPLPNISTIIYSKLHEKNHIQHPVFSSRKLDQKGVSRKL